MNDSTSTRSASSAWRKLYRRLLSDCRSMLEARWRLAVLEMRIATRQLARLGLIWAMALAAFLMAATLGLVALADLLQQLSGAARTFWLALMAAGLALLAAAASWMAWRRFHQQFVGLEESLEELREDIVWLREWLAHDGEPHDHQSPDDEPASETVPNSTPAPDTEPRDSRSARSAASGAEAGDSQAPSNGP